MKSIAKAVIVAVTVGGAVTGLSACQGTDPGTGASQAAHATVRAAHTAAPTHARKSSKVLKRACLKAMRTELKNGTDGDHDPAACKGLSSKVTAKLAAKAYDEYMADQGWTVTHQ